MHFHYWPYWSFILSCAAQQTITVTTAQVPVEPELFTKEPSSYIAPIGSDTTILTLVSGTTEWISTETANLLRRDVSTTQIGTSTATQGPEAFVIDMPTAIGTDSEQDVVVTLGPTVLHELQTIAERTCTADSTRTKTLCSDDFGPQALAVLSAYNDLVKRQDSESLLFGAGMAIASIAALVEKLIEDTNKRPILIPPKIQVNVQEIANYNSKVATPGQSTVFTVTLAATPSASLTITSTSSSTTSDMATAAPVGFEVEECWLYKQTTTDAVKDDGDDGDDDTAESERRDLSRVYGSRGLSRHKENPEIVKQIGKCPQKLEKTVRNKERHFKLEQVMRNDGLGDRPNQWWYVVRQDGTKTSDFCPIARLAHEAGSSPGFKVGNFPEGYKRLDREKGRADSRVLGVDHVYELKLLKLFFNTVLSDPNSPDCPKVIEMLMKDDKARPNVPRLQTIFNQNANKTNKALIGIDHSVNSIKGFMLQPGLEGFSSIIGPGDRVSSQYEDWVDQNLAKWNEIAMAFDYISLDVATAQFSLINTNMYRAFLAVDAIQRCEEPDVQIQWADEYKRWITTHLTTQQVQIKNHVHSLTETIKANPQATQRPRTKEKNKYGIAFDTLSRKYPDTVYQFRMDKLLDFSSQEPLDIRDIAPECTISAIATPTTSQLSESPEKPSKTPRPEPQCDMDDISGVPSNVFNTGVFREFCNEVNRNKETALVKVVDSHGNIIPPKRAARKRATRKRTPPPNADSYSQFTFSLEWTGGNDTCHADCEESFSAIATSPCGHTGSQQNSMATQSKVDRDCGSYSYKIERPETPDDDEPVEVNVGPLQCIENSGNLGRCWKDIHEDAMLDCVAEWRKWIPDDNMMDESSKNLTQVFRPSKKGVTYMMTAGWIPGCKGDPQNVRNPIPGNKEVYWKELLIRPFYDCPSNNGLGGWHDVNCLRYGFYPNNAGTFGSPPHPEKFFDGMSFCG